MRAPATSNDPLRVAIIGSGPAGFYAAEALFAHPEIDFEVDMIDRLPTPFGLVRAGVAPDHPKIKNVIRRYEKTAGHEAFRFFGNVTVGDAVSAQELGSIYDATVWAYGASADRRLGIPGEDLPGSHAATEFVAWYNGHPDFADRNFNLDCERVVVIGNGNVAADVARMLVLSREELDRTDTADHAIDAIASSSVREVLVLGRRGPAQAAFTNPEVRELGELTEAEIVIDPAQLELDDASRAFLESEAADATNRKNVETFAELAAREPSGKPKRVELRFLRSPVAIIGDQRVEGIELAVNELYLDQEGAVRARETGATESVECGLVLRSIGYLGTAVDGLPYDARRGVIPNAGGRVLADGQEPLRGHYAVGWIKRGPSGVIGTNKKDAAETIEAVFEDAAAGRLPRRDGDHEALPRLLAGRGVEYVEYDGWRAIDVLETGRGEPLGRPRVKLTSVEEMVATARERERAGSEKPEGS
jgi:ferredoxin/flavodoxin---NADP+ reductase